MPRSALLHFLYRHSSRRRHRELGLLAALMIASALLEALTIGATARFLALLTGQGGALPAGAWIDGMLDFADPVAASAGLLVGAALALMTLRLALLWRQQRFTMDYGRELSTRVFARILRQPYAAYLGQNSSDLLAGIEKTERLVQSLLHPLLQAMVALVLALFVVGAILLIAPLAAVLAILVVAAAYAVLAIVTRQRIAGNAQTLSKALAARNRIVRESLGSIRDVLLEGSQPLHEARFEANNARHRRAMAEIAFLGQAPRHLLEAVGLCALAVLAVAMSGGPQGFAPAVPILGALALGAQRLLPLLQQIWNGYSQYSAHRQWLWDVAALLDLPVEDAATVDGQRLPFRDEIRFDGVSFGYGRGDPVISTLSCSIGRGEWVAIEGASGAGKSTLADLLMGLLEPQAGRITVDGLPLTPERRRAWQGNIAHVPQSTYLIDDSIAANVALGLEEHERDSDLLVAAARAAGLLSFIERLPGGWSTAVGEGGVRLSGGQRQRIGIARALYRRRPLLVLDEATSAVDDATESAILDGIRSLAPHATVIVIAHRGSAARRCDRVIRLGSANGEAEAISPDAQRR